MITSEEIRNVTFSSSMAGYKRDEVDIFLDKIEVDIEKYETITRKQEEKIGQLEAQITELKESQNSIQSVLLNAQKLADKIVEDAKSESAKIISDAETNIKQMTEKSKLIAGELDAKASEKKERLETELAVIIKDAESKKDVVEKAAEKAVKKQQELFNRLKKEMSDFRKEITNKYKEHLELLSAIPEYVDEDPQSLAETALQNAEEEKKEIPAPEEIAEETADEVVNEPSKEEQESVLLDLEAEDAGKEEPEAENEISVTKTFDVSEISFDDNSDD